MNREIGFKNQSHVLYQAVNVFISALKLSIWILNIWIFQKDTKE